jgi:hypothetical protein
VHILISSFLFQYSRGEGTSRHVLLVFLKDIYTVKTINLIFLGYKDFIKTNLELFSVYT